MKKSFNFRVQVTNGGPWIAILRHVLQSRVKGGRCVFATFYRQEAEVQGLFVPVSRCCYPRHPWKMHTFPHAGLCADMFHAASLCRNPREPVLTPSEEDSMIRYGEYHIKRDMNKLLLLAVHLAFLLGWWKWSTGSLQVLCWPPFRWGQTCAEGAVDVSTGRSCSGWHFPSLCGDPCASMKLEAGSWKVRWLGWCPQSVKQLCRNGPDSTAAAMIKKGGLSWKCYGWLLEPR